MKLKNNFFVFFFFTCNVFFLMGGNFLPFKNLDINFSYNFFYDDNVYYAPPSNEVSSKISSFTLEVGKKESGSNFLYSFNLKFILDRYESFSLPQNNSGNINFGKYKENVDFNSEIGYRFTDRILVKLKEDFERKHRPDFLVSREVVYGKFDDNKIVAGIYYRIFTREEIKFEIGGEKVDYSRSDEAPLFSFINSNSKLLNFGFKYHFSNNFFTEIGYSRVKRDFDIELLNYRDNVYSIYLKKVLDTYMFFELNFGIQDRKYNYNLWESKKNGFTKINYTIKRERSIFNLSFTRERSLTANYSEDFYMMNLFDSKFKYKINSRNILFLNIGYRRDNFELFPADFYDTSKGLRKDKYYNFNIALNRILNEKLSLEIRYNKFKRISNNIYFPFNKNIFAITLKLNISGKDKNKNLISW